MKKLGFCFLIYDEIVLEELWHIFFKYVDKKKYCIYIHYKLNKPLKYFEKHKLNNCVQTNYADITLIKAHNVLFRKAYEDGCYKIISLSQSCVPFKSFNFIYDFLTKDNLNHFNVCEGVEGNFPRCNHLLNFYKRDIIRKSSNWFILNRKLCEKVAYFDTNLIDSMYGPVGSPEEHFYIIMVLHNNLDNETIMTPNLANDATTFTNWPGMDYKYVFQPNIGDRLPKMYNNISVEELNYLIKSKCLFGRKFKKECYSSFVNKTYMNMLKDGVNIDFEDSFKSILEESYKVDNHLGNIMKSVYLNYI